MPRPYIICIDGALAPEWLPPKWSGKFTWWDIPALDQVHGIFAELTPTKSLLFTAIKSQNDVADLAQIKWAFPACIIVGIIAPEDKALGFEAYRVGVEEVLMAPLSSAGWEEAWEKLKPQLEPSGILQRLSQWLKPPVEKRTVRPFDQAVASVKGDPPKELLTGRDIPGESSAILRVRMLGTLTFEYQGNTLPHPKGKLLSIWVYLLLYPRRSIPRDTLIETFWPGVSRESGRNSLHNAMCKLRKFLKSWDPEREFIQLAHDCYSFSPEIQVITDVCQFTQALNQGKQWEHRGNTSAALEQYKYAAKVFSGPFFPQNQQDDWVVDENEHLRENYLFALDRLSNYYSNNGTPALAITYCQKILAADNSARISTVGSCAAITA